MKQTEEQTGKGEGRKRGKGKGKGRGEITDRQKEALKLAALGFTAIEMGERMRCKGKTAGALVKTGMRKLGFTRRMQITGWALRQGLIEAGELEANRKREGHDKK